MGDEELTAARAAADQAEAALVSYRPTADGAQAAYAAIVDERNAALASFKERLNAAAGPVEETSAELERREGAARAAHARIADLEAGGTGEAPPAQEVG